MFAWSQGLRRPMAVGAEPDVRLGNAAHGPPSGAGRVDALDVGGAWKFAGCLHVRTEVDMLEEGGDAFACSAA